MEVCVVNFTLQPPFSQETRPSTDWIAEWVSSRTGLNFMAKMKFLPLPETEILSSSL